jgi:hypothetical protein
MTTWGEMLSGGEGRLSLTASFGFFSTTVSFSTFQLVSELALLEAKS